MKKILMALELILMGLLICTGNFQMAIMWLAMFLKDVQLLQYESRD